MERNARRLATDCPDASRRCDFEGTDLDVSDFISSGSEIPLPHAISRNPGETSQHRIRGTGRPRKSGESGANPHNFALLAARDTQ